MVEAIPVKWRLEATILRLLLWGFGLLGVERASAMGGAIARVVGPKLGVNKRAAHNLKLIFPDITDEALARITREMWENLGRTAAEYAHLDKFDPYREGGRILVRNLDRLDDLLTEGRGVIFVGGHLGNWELQTIAAARKGIPVMAVYRA
ncbi:MAG TPA: lipid A biosynthesis acyltransferase, partial [Alphaproteobacteria bacterium]|nr:lipid A biosynthesis acyltransferase [Alphaproteobacteria bacterium]